MGIFRLLLAFSVVVIHSNPEPTWFMDGKLAVRVFYIISGFYMTLILNEKYIGQNSSYKLFITNRLLRLYPIYWVILLLTLITGFTNGLLDPYFKYFDDMTLSNFYIFSIY